MVKLKICDLNEYEIKKYLGDLYKSLAVITDPEEMKDFLGSLLSSSEKVMLARRIQVGNELMVNKTYSEIMDKLHVGTSTIMFVERALTRMFYHRKKRKNQVKTSRKTSGGIRESFTWEELKNNYPAHFLLFGDLWKNK
jgi:uncharacterized protein YerC